MLHYPTSATAFLVGEQRAAVVRLTIGLPVQTGAHSMDALPTALTDSDQMREIAVMFSGVKSSLNRALTSVDLHLSIVRPRSRKGSKSDTELAHWDFQTGA